MTDANPEWIRWALGALAAATSALAARLWQVSGTVASKAERAEVEKLHDRISELRGRTIDRTEMDKAWAAIERNATSMAGMQTLQAVTAERLDTVAKGLEALQRGVTRIDANVTRMISNREAGD